MFISIAETLGDEGKTILDTEVLGAYKKDKAAFGAILEHILNNNAEQAISMWAKDELLFCKFADGSIRLYKIQEG